MIKVRFESGQTVTYGTANQIYRATSGEPFHRLVEKRSNGTETTIALVPVSACLELAFAARVENPLVGQTTEAALAMLCKNIKSLDPYSQRPMLRDLKRLLAKYDIKRRIWKD